MGRTCWIESDLLFLQSFSCLRALWPLKSHRCTSSLANVLCWLSIEGFWKLSPSRVNFNEVFEFCNHQHHPLFQITCCRQGILQHDSFNEKGLSLKIGLAWGLFAGWGSTPVKHKGMVWNFPHLQNSCSANFKNTVPTVVGKIQCSAYLMLQPKQQPSRNRCT